MSTKTDRVSTQSGNNSEASSGASAWMAGFFVLGVLLGMPGSLMIGWQYHIDLEPAAIGPHFLAMSGGFVLCSVLIPRLLGNMQVRLAGIWATGLALLALAGLALVPPPAAVVWRIALLAATGVSAGALTRALFFANRAAFERSPASSSNRAGALFVGGALLATITVGTTYFGGSIHIQTAILAAVPAVYLIALLADRFPSGLLTPIARDEDILRETLKDLRSIATVLFSLLIFCQFACEWAIAGWLPLFLIHTTGVNPVTAIWTLALYFFALMIGRLVAQLFLPIVSHKKMLLVSVACAMAGYLLLSLTAVTFFSMMAAVVLGLSHAPIYPLLAERLDDRFSYHPGFYSGTLSFALAGAMATPWLLAYVAESFGMRAVMLIPAVCSIAVLILSILIMIESRLMSSKQDVSHHGLLASDK